MESLTKHTGVVAVLDRSNIDTDQIIPGQFLKRIERSGFGAYLFYAWRFIGGDESKPNPEFVLNQKPFQNASILIARENFGCGSSREHAPWALADYGFRVVIAPSFADIFFNNSFKNGMLPIVLENRIIDELMGIVNGKPGVSFTVDLTEKTVVLPDGKTIPFDVDPFRRECLLNGWDDIGLTLRHASDIDRFETKQKEEKPFLSVVR